MRFVTIKTFELFHELIPYSSINSHREIDSIFNTLENIKYVEIDPLYLKKTKSSDNNYKHLLRKKTYYIIYRSDLMKKIAGNVQIKNLLPRNDNYYGDCIIYNEPIYWLIDKKVVHKLFDLQEELKTKNYNPNALTVRNGHRYPKYNEDIGGASKSKHISGQAIDVTVGDVDKNGTFQEKDKKIVLDILEKKIIKDKGGIGLYPGTRSVHFDTRGKKARWNTYKPYKKRKK